ncbi:hypothetical protein AcV7_008173 [Taiwanofungus camphoratus]|nr:hypothetical protein AcV7_008173 [Antrodia cinnamomea]
MTVAASELQSVKDELQALGMAIAHIHEQYSIATQKVDAMTKMLQSKLDDLEADNKKQASEMVSLRTKNAELQNLVETKKPDVWKAIDARDVALFKLSHARRVIRDLLDERKQIDPSGPRVTSLRSSRHGGAVTSDRSSGSWDELDLTEAGPSSPSDGDDDRTVRPRAPTTASTIVASSPTGSDAEAYEQRSCTGMDKDESTTLKARQGSPEDTLTERELASSSSQDLVSTSQDGWYLEYLKPPATAEASIGGFTYPALAEFLKLDDDTMICIESLEWWEDPCMRIHIHVDMAFVYNPLVLEGPSNILLMGGPIVHHSICSSYLLLRMLGGMSGCIHGRLQTCNQSGEC